MRLDQLLKRIGAELVKAEQANGRVVLFVRAGTAAEQATRWKLVIEGVLLAHHEQKGPRWDLDLSKAFFVNEGGAIRYLWRFVLTGDVKRGAESVGFAVSRALATGAEITEMPLVGQVQYPFDPQNGRIKGGHTSERAARARAVAMSGGSIQ
jgi:hypothetical protein